MKQILPIAIALLSILLFDSDANAQRRRTGSIAFGGQVLQPLGDFAQQYDGYPIGVGGTLSIPLWRSPLEVGGGYAWNNMGSQNEDVSVFVTTDKDGDDIFASGEMRIRSSINRYQAFARLRPLNGAVQPYGELIAGMDVFKTNHDITINQEGYSEAGNSQKNHQDMTLSVGWAAGLRIRLAPNVFVEGRFENLTSGKVSYVDQKSIVVNDNNNITFDLRESKANRYTYQLGLAFSF
jgi:opacity protein-like surface antigen